MYALIACFMSCRAWNRVILGAGPLGLLPGNIFEGTKLKKKIKNKMSEGHHGQTEG